MGGLDQTSEETHVTAFFRVPLHAQDEPPGRVLDDLDEPVVGPAGRGEPAGVGHPLVVVGEYGKGRIVTYMSDPAPHWGINFELWKGYDAFWQQSLQWVKKKHNNG